MSHNIDFSKGEAAIVLRGRPAWHGLGKIMKIISPQEALTLGGLDYEVLKVPNTHNFPTNPKTGEPLFPPIISEESFFTFRTDTGGILGDKLGSYYNVLQNADAVEMIKPLCERGFKINVAGAICGGATIFLCLELGEYAVADDKVKTYFVFTNSHDGSRMLYGFFTDVRVVCWNTLNFALSTAQNVVKIRHTGDVKKRTEKALEIMTKGSSHMEEAEKAFGVLVERPFSEKRFFDYVANVLLTNKERTELSAGKAGAISTRKANLLSAFFDYAQHGPGQQKYIGTAWGAYNAVTGFLGNVKNYKDDDTRTKSLWFGESRNTSVKAFKLAYDTAKIEPLSKSANIDALLN